MSTSINYGTQNSLRTEIATLQKDVLAFKPCNGIFSVPALLGNDEDYYINLPIPLYVSICYGDKVIPKGTKFIIQTVAGNYNDLRVIGLYDKQRGFDFIEFIKKYISGEESIYPDDYEDYKYDEIKSQE